MLLAERSTARARNQQLAEREFEAGVAKVGSLPHVIHLETTTFCNLKCVMCAHGNSAVSSRAHLDPELASKLSGILPYASNIWLFAIGEPLMSPAFWSTLESLPPDLGTDVGIYSNGTLLSHERIERILASALTEINISLDAATPETYRRIRGSNFHQVVERVRELVRRRNLRERRRLTILINMALMRENIEELPRFMDLAADLGVDKVAFWHLSDQEQWNDWTTTKGDWKFVYREQLLTRDPKLANEMIRSAQKRAEELGVTIRWAEHRSVFLDEGNS